MNACFRAPLYLTLITLTACPLPTKLGNLSDSASDGMTPEETTASTQWTATDGETSAGTTLEPELTSTTKFDPSETTGGETEGETTVIGTASATSESSDTETPVACDGLDQATCEAVGVCVTHFGVAYDFPGCPSGQVYLGCSDPQDCDEAEHPFCKDGTDEVYQLPSGCHPSGFTLCEAPGIAFCETCEALTEAECLEEPEGCQPIYGAPHVEVEGEVCADYENKEFLRCIANGGACPPFVPVVCEVGNTDKRWDSPSGCVPAGFEECATPEFVPGCM
ncbi:hypothetical protein [Nannocystis sp. SCPEA4]|uniref:hypothetical protein n=1 Tax=Nannocystis sp. SCPEA4 TaxID=2996787 RepID=UPI00227072C3|nr:hypothetical protein [Nannocystis sp. SCPEA4]MCY1061777.1 hypothetical protein [Nannocystis sp. SCPEA4]